MYGSLVAAPDSIRTGLLNLFRPRTSPPDAATVLREPVHRAQGYGMALCAAAVVLVAAG